MNGQAPADHIYFAARRPGWQVPQLHQDLQLDSFEVLEQNNDRQTCPKCGCSRCWYCYDCLHPITPVPRIALPFKVTIITHQQEPPSKNTGVQTAILAPEHVDLHRIESLPAFDPARCVVLYPSDEAVTPCQLEGSADDIDRVFIIDSKWKKAKELVAQPQFAGVRHVKLADKRSAFWRFHTKGVTDEGVCTAEALFFLLKELQDAGKIGSDPAMQGEHYFDNLLWYFSYQHMFIQQRQGAKLEERAARLQAQAAGGQQKLRRSEKRRLMQQQQQAALQKRLGVGVSGGEQQEQGQQQQQQQQGKEQKGEEQQEEQQEEAAAGQQMDGEPDQQAGADTAAHKQEDVEKQETTVGQQAGASHDQSAAAAGDDAAGQEGQLSKKARVS